MKVALDQNSLIQLLQSKSLDPSFQKESGQLVITLSIKETEIPLFLTIISDGFLLQGIAYLPYKIFNEAKAQVARILHLINKELDMPGFGMDEEYHFMFYRFVIPLLHKELEIELLDMHLTTTKLVCETFMNALAVAASGSGDMDEIIKQHKRNSNAS